MTTRKSPRDRSKVAPQGEDADFLVEEFAVPASDAAALVTSDGGDADAVGAKVSERQRKRDALKDVPSAEAPRDDIVPDSDEQALKPVLRRPNRRIGAG